MTREAQTLAVAFPSHRPHVMTGLVELNVASAVSPRLSRPHQVSGVLSTVFDQIGGGTADLALIRRLASGAREWLLQRAAALFWKESDWFQSTCASCQTAYDLPLTLAAAPRKAASVGFPVVKLRTSLGERAFESPNGLHEEALSQLDSGDPKRALVAECGLGRNPKADALAFTETDLEAIEAALDAASPDIADEVSTICPVCKTPAVARIDPLEFAFPRVQNLLAEVHALAATYHWSEDAILALPSHRRRAYASLIKSGSRR